MTKKTNWIERTRSWDDVRRSIRDAGGMSTGKFVRKPKAKRGK